MCAPCFSLLNNKLKDPHVIPDCYAAKKKKKSTEKIQLLCHAFGFIFENVIVVSILRN